jgi:hypothetical protein
VSITQRHTKWAKTGKQIAGSSEERILMKQTNREAKTKSSGQKEAGFWV